MVASRPSRANPDPPPGGGMDSLWKDVNPRFSRRGRWRSGWDREEVIQASLLHAERSLGLLRYRSGGYAQGTAHKQRAIDLAWVVEVLRQAAYIQRAELAIDLEWSETRQAGVKADGTPNLYKVRRHDLDPGAHSKSLAHLAGYEVVDCAHLAYRAARCEAHWRMSLRLGVPPLSVVSSPARCGLTKICPHCAHFRANRRAGEVRRAIEVGLEAGELEELALMTLTQRAEAGEKLWEAVLRFRGAMSRLMSRERMSDSRRRRWDATVAGLVWSVEVTRSWEGKAEGTPQPSPAQCWWHVHAHAVVALRPGVTQEEAARSFGTTWERVSALESGPGRGWDPCAGGVPEDRSRWAVGGWWRPIDPSNLREVYQATKYLCKPGSLNARELLEMLTVTRGKRWQGATGTFYGMVSADKDAPEEGDEEDSVHRPDAGRPLAALMDCPDEDGDDDVVSWPIKPADVEEVKAALEHEPDPRVAPVLVKLWDQGRAAPVWRLVAHRSWAHTRALTHSLSVAEADLARVEARVEERLGVLAAAVDRLSLQLPEAQGPAQEKLQRQISGLQEEAAVLLGEISEAAERIERWEGLVDLLAQDLGETSPLAVSPSDDLPY